MKNHLQSLISISALVVGLSSIASANTIWIYPAYGPANTVGGFTSTYAATFEQNAVTAMMNIASAGSTAGSPANTGNVTDPGYYSAITACDTTCNLAVNGNGMITTTTNGSDGYNSWMGNNSPTGAFSNEFGNALYFSLAIYSPVAFNPDDIVFNDNQFGFNTSLAGVNYGFTAGASSYATGCLGTMSAGSCIGTFQSSGTPDGTNNVNYFFYSGFVLYDTETDPSSAAEAARILAGLDIDGTYSLTPEPGGLLLLGCGILGVGLLRKRFQH